MYKDRQELYGRIESARQSKLIMYVTGDRRNLETQIAHDVIDPFVHHLDAICPCKRLSLFLYTRGGETLAAWSLVNLLKQFADELEVIVPSKALSAGTLICLGADTIVMTKQATLGPIDPSVHTPMNPHIDGAPPSVRFPVSVEDLNGFVEFCRNVLGDQADLSKIILALTEKVHPLVLGKAYRARRQIRMLADRLLQGRIKDEKQRERLLEFLCSESGSHDYTISRREARDDLGLPIEEPDSGLYELINSVYEDMASELQLFSEYDPASYIGANQTLPYSFQRGLIESIAGGSHAFVSEGVLIKRTARMDTGIEVDTIEDKRDFEGWRLQHEGKRQDKTDA